jgi:hypothetical protein
MTEIKEDVRYLQVPQKHRSRTHIYLEFCYGVYNQHESFIYLDLMIKNREVPIERYFK